MSIRWLIACCKRSNLILSSASDCLKINRHCAEVFSVCPSVWCSLASSSFEFRDLGASAKKFSMVITIMLQSDKNKIFFSNVHISISFQKININKSKQRKSNKEINNFNKTQNLILQMSLYHFFRRSLAVCMSMTWCCLERFKKHKPMKMSRSEQACLREEESKERGILS